MGYKKKAIIFDMDGVIIDSEPTHVRAEKEVFEKFNIPVQPEDWFLLKGKTDLGAFGTILEKYGIKEYTAQQLADEKMRIYPALAAGSLKLFDGFPELIAYIRPRYKTGLATSSQAMLQEAVFRQFSLQQYFDAVVNAEMVKKGKPDPEPYLLAMQKLGAAPLDSLVLEDADNGILSAKRAGARVIAVTHTLSRERLEKAHPDYIVNSLQEILELLQKGIF